MRGWILGLAPRRRLLMLGLVVVVALLAGGIVAVGAHAAPPVDATPHRFGGRHFRFARVVDAPPVILVPGYGDDLASFEDLTSRLEFSGRFALVMNLPDDGMGDLNVQAEALQRLVERFRQRPVDVIGYSAGGVVVRLWIAKYGGASEVRRVVTLGSPLHGANIAGIGS
ncbi:MAG TPA: alpha/beta fold hydrolase, partial [Micromonosporaceae bacterium]